MRRRRDAYNAAVDSRLAAKHSEAEAIRTYLRMRSLYEGSAPPAPKLTALSLESPFYGKPIAEAGAVLLEQVGHPMTEEEIMEGLRAAGVPITSVNPVVNFRMAARRRPDLLFTKSGFWHRAVHDAAQEAAAPPSTGCVPNRDRELHMAKSLEGLALARARGVVGGRRSTMAPGTREKALQMATSVEEGGEGIPVREVAAQLGISRPVVYKILKSAKAQQPMANGMTMRAEIYSYLNHPGHAGVMV